MKRVLLLLFWSAACSAEKPYVHIEPAVRPLEKTGGTIEHARLSNGLEVIVGTRPGTMAHVTYAWQVPGQETGNGLALADMIRRDERWRNLDRFDTYFFVTTSDDGSSVSVSVRADDVPAVMAVMADVIGKPRCSGKPFDREPHGDAGPFLFGRGAFYLALSGRTPRSAHPITACTTMLAFAVAVLDPTRSALVVAGPFDAATIAGHAHGFEAVQRAEKPAPLRELWSEKPLQTTATTTTSSDTRFIVAIGRSIPYAELDALQIQVMHKWESALKYGAARLGEDSRVAITERADGVLLSIELLVRPADATQRLFAASHMLEAVSENTGNDLYASPQRAMLVQEYLHELETADAFGKLLVEAFLRRQPYNEPLLRAETIAHAPAGDANGWAKRVLDLDRMTVAFTGDPETVKTAIAAWTSSRASTSQHQSSGPVRP